jgi:Rho GTPase-activating protein 22/24/25
MEIGWPTDVRHVAHVTFDRLRGFLVLPFEFEIEIPGQVPSARYGFRNSSLFSLKLDC